MTYYGAKELAASFRTVRKNTIIIAEEIGEEHYGFHPAPGTRTVAETLVHIAIVPRLTHQIHGIDHLSDMNKFDFLTFFGGLIMVEKEPHTKARVVALLKEEGDRFAGWLDGLSEDFLGERVTLPNGMGEKSRFEAILGVKEHEMHHRGQLMLVERILGQTPHLTRDMEARIAAMQAKAGA
jgi:uncharacterized damage-inducible protein DinB